MLLFVTALIDSSNLLGDLYKIKARLNLGQLV